MAAFIVLAPVPRGFRRAAAGQHGLLARAVRVNLRSPSMRMLYAQGFLLMGGFVVVYNYLAFRLREAPFGLGTTLTSLLFLTYLSGTWSARRAGAAAGRHGRKRVLLASVAVMVAGVLLTLAPWLPAILAGLVTLTIGFFGAHAIASGWTGAGARTGRAQAASLYNLSYYLGSSIVGWLGGLVFTHAGWDATVGVVAGLALAAGLWAAADSETSRTGD